jgi:hypothetical protein
MRIEIDELVQSVNDELQMIADHADDIQARMDALGEIEDAVSRALVHLRERAASTLARRQADGMIDVSIPGTPVMRLPESDALALRDQLDVALHVPPPPDLPVDSMRAGGTD